MCELARLLRWMVESWFDENTLHGIESAEFPDK